MIIRIVSLLIGYALGMLNLTYFISRKKGIDIRHQGSGNLGATNALRVMGIKAGICALVFDCCKCVMACLLTLIIFGGEDDSLNLIYMIYAGIGAITGHCFPFYLGFKGGKGVACALGMALAVDWRMALICVAIFLVIVLAWKFVSLGSILGAASVVCVWILFFILGLRSMTVDTFVETLIIWFAASSIIIIKHAPNIVRLMNGTESRLGKSGAK